MSVHVKVVIINVQSFTIVTMMSEVEMPSVRWVVKNLPSSLTLPYTSADPLDEDA